MWEPLFRVRGDRVPSVSTRKEHGPHGPGADRRDPNRRLHQESALAFDPPTDTAREVLDDTRKEYVRGR